MSNSYSSLVTIRGNLDGSFALFIEVIYNYIVADSIAVFSQIIHAKKSGQSPLAIFDLDSTLFDIKYRSQQILNDISELPEMQSKWPSESHQLKEVEIVASDWGIRQALIRSGLKASLDFFEAVRNHWRQRFFSNEYLSCDQTYEGSVEYVKALVDKGIQVMYLTGRVEELMGLGTQESLIQKGFPVALGADTQGQLFMKPSQDMKDLDFKKNFMIELQHNHKEVWFFENEASIVDLVEKHTPDINIVFIDTIHSGRSNSPTHLPTIRGKYELP